MAQVTRHLALNNHHPSMEEKEALNILIKLLEKVLLDKEEKIALKIAIGSLSWLDIAKKSIKKRALAIKKRHAKIIQ